MRHDSQTNSVFARLGMPTTREATLATCAVLVVCVVTVTSAGEQPQDAAVVHWAFQRPVRHSVATDQNVGSVRNPIDAFIVAEQIKHGLQPSAPASKEVLLRRVYLDLIGLPPTREQLRAFLADTSANAYENVVDRLLASPQYGERWARHWMDVWRYSDWYGRRSVPDVWNSAPQIWRWRDWIVRSLNADKGYDRMVMEMLAADEIAPEDEENAVATGYLVRNWYALNPNQWMRESVEHVGKAFLGLTLNCAHCHDHKYDPITNEDYFRFRAFFEPLELRQDRVPGEADPGPFQKYNYSVLRKVVQLGSIRVFDEKLDAPTVMYRGGDERSKIEDRPPVTPGVPAFLLGSASPGDEGEDASRELKINAVELPPGAYYPGYKPWVQQAAMADRESAVRSAETDLAAIRKVVEQATPGLADKLAQLEAQLKDAAKSAGNNAESLKPLEQQVQIARQAVEARRLSVVAAEAKLAAGQAELASVQARIAADGAKFGAQGNAESLAKAASQAERQAVLQSAQATLAIRRHALADAEAKPLDDKNRAGVIQAAQNQVTEAQKAVDSAQAELAAESSKYTPLSPVYPTRSSGRRKALAEWIASPQNPLTARVAVNHVWMRHFGRPLAASVTDFGRNGKAPTHPNLIDWLACELMEHGWSMKRLHRLIVTSNTYRQASGQRSAVSDQQTAKGNLQLDTDNRYYWRFPQRRVEAEVVRDSLLHAAGQIDGQLGGQPLENNLEPTARRRSLYFAVYPEDGGNMKFLEQFDAPDACDCYRRTESLIPQQALALTNSRITMDMSRLLARKLWAEASAREPIEELRELSLVIAAFEQILTRRPTSAEQAICIDFLHKQAELFRGADPKQPAVLTPSGAVPPAADPVQRACESLINSLFSHTEFVTMK